MNSWGEIIGEGSKIRRNETNCERARNYFTKVREGKLNRTLDRFLLRPELFSEFVRMTSETESESYQLSV